MAVAAEQRRLSRQTVEVSLVRWCLMKKLDYGRERLRAIRGQLDARLDESGKWRVRVPVRELEEHGL